MWWWVFSGVLFVAVVCSFLCFVGLVWLVLCLFFFFVCGLFVGLFSVAVAVVVFGC